MGSEGVEVQALEGEGGQPSCIVVVPSNIERKSSPLLSITGEKASADDASTARTEVSTVVDSYGSHYLSDGGTFTFNSPATSFDGAQMITRARSTQGDQNMLSIPELPLQGTRGYKEASLMDLDDSDTDLYEGGTKTTLGKKLSIERREVGGDHSVIRTNQSIASSNMHRKSHEAEFYRAPSLASPSSIDWNALETSASRAQFYGGPNSSNCASSRDTLHHQNSSVANHGGQPPLLSPASMSINATDISSVRRAQFYEGYRSPWNGTASPWSVAGHFLQSTDGQREFYGSADRRPYASAGSMFADGTLNTDSRIGFYRVECSDSAAEPLTCREKIVQPALSCDEDFWKERPKKEAKDTEVNSSREEDRSGSVFSAVKCCFAPTPP